MWEGNIGDDAAMNDAAVVTRPMPADLPLLVENDTRIRPETEEFHSRGEPDDAAAIQKS